MCEIRVILWVFLSFCRRCGSPIWLTSVTPIPAADDQAMVAVPLEEAIVCSQHRFFGDFNPCSFAAHFGALPSFFLLFLENANKPFKNAFLFTVCGLVAQIILNCNNQILRGDKKW